MHKSKLFVGGGFCPVDFFRELGCEGTEITGFIVILQYYFDSGKIPPINCSSPIFTLA